MIRIFVIFIVCIVFCSCGAENEAYVSTPIVTPMSEEDVRLDEEAYEAIINEAMTQYNGTMYFIDSAFNKNVYIIGETGIVSLLAVEGVQTTSEMMYSAVASIEQTAFGEFAAISVKDISGNTLSLTLSEEDAEKFISVVNSMR